MSANVARLALHLGVTMRIALTVVLSLALATGCHSRFKKHVGSIDDVRADMIVTTGPHVALGGVQGDGLAALAINTVQGVKSIDLTRKVGDAVDPSAVGAAFADEVAAAFGKGPPFNVDPASDTSLQIELLSYGIDVAGLGMPGALTYSLRTRIYLPDGQLVYTAGHNCAVSFSDPSAAAIVFGAVNNAKAIKDMKPKEIEAMFEGGAQYCAQQTVMRIRRHGG